MLNEASFGDVIFGGAECPAMQLRKAGSLPQAPLTLPTSTGARAS